MVKEVQGMCKVVGPYMEWEKKRMFALPETIMLYKNMLFINLLTAFYERMTYEKK